MMDGRGGHIERLRQQGLEELGGSALRIAVGMGTCGRAAGASEVFDAMESALAGLGGHVALEAVGCKGLCFAEPLVEVSCPGAGSLMLGDMKPENAATLAQALATCDGTALPELPDTLRAHVVDPAVLQGQQRRVMSNCGEISPVSLAQYIARGGYSALEKALASAPADIVDVVEQSNLRGRGGAGFPAGEKWRACADAPASEKYFIMNGDEGDPGAYMDRSLLESDPHRVLEGLIIGCYAIGAHRAYCFIRAEYPLAVATMRRAIADAYEANLLGADVLGSGFDLEVQVVRGAGAFLCGESTAMVNVLENGECTTRHKPPHLSERGLWGCPTCLNNVETLANVPLIVENGAAWFKETGTGQSPGTKIFSVTGSVARGGLVEVGLGTSLGDVVHVIAGAQNPKAVQVGGPSGAILPASLSDLPLSFEGLSDVGAMIGSGGFVVLDDQKCVVETASYLVRFSASQSCRKCRPCAEGLDECVALYDKITAGQGTADDIERLHQVAQRNCASRLCGLGRTALSPVLSSLRYFRDEYEAHLQGCCPGLACAALVSYEIVKEKCQGERCCLLTCPGNAIKGPFGKPGRIVARLCQRCGMCKITCPYGAVRKVSPAQ